MKIENKIVILPIIRSPYLTCEQKEAEYIIHYIEESLIHVAYGIIDKVPSEHGIYKLHVLEVEKTFRNKGIGSHLLKYLIETYKEIYLDSVSESIDFFIKFGAIPIAKHFAGKILLFSEKDPLIAANYLFKNNRCVEICT